MTAPTASRPVRTGQLEVEDDRDGDGDHPADDQLIADPERLLGQDHDRQSAGLVGDGEGLAGLVEIDPSLGQLEVARANDLLGRDGGGRRRGRRRHRGDDGLGVIGHRGSPRAGSGDRRRSRRADGRGRRVGLRAGTSGGVDGRDRPGRDGGQGGHGLVGQQAGRARWFGQASVEVPHEVAAERQDRRGEEEPDGTELAQHDRPPGSGWPGGRGLVRYRSALRRRCRRPNGPRCRSRDRSRPGAGRRRPPAAPGPDRGSARPPG